MSIEPVRSEYEKGKKAIIGVVSKNKNETGGDDKDVNAFVATVFGKIYEELLNYYFSRQKFTKSSYPTWHPAGVALVQRMPNASKVRQDFLLESTVDSGSGPTGHRLVCFEAKSWPSYRGLGYLEQHNVSKFINETDKFIKDIRREPEQWVMKFPDGEIVHQKPDSFGYLVFDYDVKNRNKILATIQERAPEITELESITGLLSMILYNGKIRDDELAVQLKKKLNAVNVLFNLFI